MHENSSSQPAAVPVLPDWLRFYLLGCFVTLLIVNVIITRVFQDRKRDNLVSRPRLEFLYPRGWECNNLTFWNNLHINLEQASGRCQDSGVKTVSASEESLTQELLERERCWSEFPPTIATIIFFSKSSKYFFAGSPDIIRVSPN